MGHILPPGQQLAAAGKWPLVGERLPAAHDGPWCVGVSGLVDRPLVLSVDELRSLRWVERAIDVHCVTRWSKPGMRFGGVPLAGLLERAGVRPEARFISFVSHSPRAHSTSLALADALSLDVLVALEQDGRPLPVEHGGPVRTVTPGRYFYKSLKWLARIELLEQDRLGYWEAAAGYHNRARPALEERFVATSIDKRLAARLLTEKDFRGQTLLGLAAAGHALPGLQAQGAVLRNADCSGCDLREASFDGANLSLSRLRGADLRGASLRDADLEGVDFSGADLRQADLRGSDLTAATFCGEAGRAKLDETTRLDAGQVAGLMPEQEAFVRAAGPSP